MHCPSCGLFNPSEALVCDCGHRFSMHEPTGNHPFGLNSTREDVSTARRLGFIVLGCLLGSITGIIYGALFALLVRSIAGDAQPSGQMEYDFHELGTLLAVEIYGVFGWAAGLVVGGVSGLMIGSQGRGPR